jgi:hypothetical protein
MMELSDRIQDAVDRVAPPPAGDPGLLFLRGQQRARQRRLGQAATGLGVILAIVGLVIVQVVTPTMPGIVDQPGAVALPLPERGDVAAEFVNGHPVFVVHDDDGQVRVLDAVDSHEPHGMLKVLAWCRTSHVFEDLWHASRFDSQGRWIGGPAPTGMAPYQVLAVTDRHVVVGDRLPAPARARERDLPRGPSCDDRTALYLPNHPADPTVLDDLVIHSPPDGDTDLTYPTPERILGHDARS